MRMKKLLLALAIFFSCPIWAEWVRYEETVSSTNYFDPATIRKDGNMRKVWELHDLSKRHKDGEISRRVRKEYDCKQERWRILNFSFHSEPMAGGEVLSMGGEDNNWMAIAPGTSGETIFNIVCAK